MVKLKVVEVFESIQGEVPLGKYALFIRLYGCNMRCPFCDTQYSWSSTYFELDIDSLHVPKSINYIVFTGGEPLLQKTELEEFIRELKKRRSDIKVALETNGKITDFDYSLFDLIVISPKDIYTLKDWIPRLKEHDNLVIKIVDKPEDEQVYIRLRKYIDDGLLDPTALHKIYIMPFGTRINEINENLKRILKRLVKYDLKGINIAYRLHIALGLK